MRSVNIYRARSPGSFESDGNSAMKGNELPRKEIADVGAAIDYEAELAALPKVNPGGLPLAPMLSAAVNAELQKRLAPPGPSNETGVGPSSAFALAASRRGPQGNPLRP